MLTLEVDYIKLQTNAFTLLLNFTQIFNLQSGSLAHFYFFLNKAAPEYLALLLEPESKMYTGVHIYYYFF